MAGSAATATVAGGNPVSAATLSLPFGGLAGSVAVPAVAGSGCDPRPVYEALKRTLDVSIALLLLLVLVAPFLLIALLLLVEGGGSMLYRQPRVGRHGRIFMLYKFRTMRADRRRGRRRIPFADRRVALKSPSDPRITRLGGWLRSSSIDELPQLVNVLRGDMSLVGPRPEQMDILAYYRPEHFARHSVQPGLTGWWQITSRCGRNGPVKPIEDLESKLADDLHYIQHRSLGLDALILLRTIPVVLTGRGAM